MGVEQIARRAAETAQVPEVHNRRVGRARRVLPVLNDRQIYLAGGTSVALQLGHRRSVDLDWFSDLPIDDPMALAGDIKSAQVPFETKSVGRGTLHGQVLGVETSILEFKYPLLRPPLVCSDLNCHPATNPPAMCF